MIQTGRGWVHMYLDVADLHTFYASPLGQVAGMLLRRRLRELWPDVRGCRILGMGFTTPLLGPFADEAERVVAAMPGPQGVMEWPGHGGNRVTLTEDTSLPFPDCLFDRVIVCHAIEHTDQTRALMRELWRVMADNGRIAVITPNRQGIWARMDRTPFGAGRPCSAGQLSRLLDDALFTTLGTSPALFFPPVGSRIPTAWAQGVENIGEHWFPQFSGVLVAEAGKKIYATPRQEHAAGQRVGLGVPDRLNLGPRSKSGVFYGDAGRTPGETGSLSGAGSLRPG